VALENHLAPLIYIKSLMPANCIKFSARVWQVAIDSALFSENKFFIATV